MKLQDVILKAMARKITWMAAAEIAGVTDRTMRRIKQRYEKFGYDGLFDQRRGKRSIHRVPLETAERVLALYQEKYFDFSVLHFHEKLQQEHNIRLSYSWVKRCDQRDLLRATSGGGIHGDGHGGVAGSGGEQGCVLFAVQRPGEPLFLHAGGGRQGG